jgi:acyl-CoA thioester hydrolase
MNPPYYDHIVRVGYADTDRMGFAHHRCYLVWFEAARTEMLRTGGDSYKAWEERGIMLPLTESHTEYQKAALYDDILTIRTRIAGVNRLRLHFSYEVRCDARGVAIAKGATHHVFMAPDGRPIRVAPDVVAKLETWTTPRD